MNEVVKKLSLDCGAWHQVYDQKRFMVNKNFDVEKFAELIVRECIEQVITGPNRPAHYAVEAALRLKKHFGVDE